MSELYGCAGRPPRTRISLPLAAEEFHGEHSPVLEDHFSRRDFLKASGFAFAGALISGCRRAPQQEAIPPLIQVADTVPCRADYYASTCRACSAQCGMLVKSLDGRPIKLEGNPDHPMSKGGLCAVGQASILGLYDRLRLQLPHIGGQPSAWEDIDREIRNQLDDVRSKGGAVRVLSGTITSPTMLATLQRFLSLFPDARHVVYDSLSCSAILDAHERTHGVRVLPRFHFDRAEVIFGVDADFLGTWISPVEFAADYRAGRSLSGNPPRSSYHVQIESRLTLSVSKADKRLCVAPDEMISLIPRLAVVLARRAGVELDLAATAPGADSLAQPLSEFAERLAERLWQARGHGLVVCGSQDTETQVACNFINHVLRNYGSTLDIENPSFQRQGSDRDLKTLLQELQSGKVAALLILDCNPAYDLPDADVFAQALKQVPLTVCLAERLDETSRIVRYICPHPHFLESWEDTESQGGVLGLRQPTIPRLGQTRPILESFATWIGAPKPAYDLLREYWEAHIFPRQVDERTFQVFWDRSVHDGHTKVTPIRRRPNPFNLQAARAALATTREMSSGPILVLYPKVTMLEGGHAYNPWLQELPDPISKVAWDNYACLAPGAARELGVVDGDMINVEVSEHDGKTQTIDLPAFVQPGQHDRVVGIALGYGSLASARFAQIGPQWIQARPTVGENGLVGRNAASLLEWKGDTLRYSRGGVKLTKKGTKHSLASTQSHHSLTLPGHLAPPGHERRPVIQETTLAELAAQAVTGQSLTDKSTGMWPQDHPYREHRWGMVIDLNACTGCSACVIACQSENNIPVVGKDEVLRQREMHWLRIDRYFSGADAGVEVAFQPMLCQHCERAPCETVCPVLATVHSAEGLNEQVYNRCVGTRYCANNCPYKVRRFNWFAYSHEDHLQNLALNPDVTVRSRGVMEKCTFCIQRIQEARLEAKQRGEPLRDGAVQTACQQSCPSRAITFGDLHDPASLVGQRRNDPRLFHTLAELNIGPSVGYLKIVRSRSEDHEEQGHG